MENLKNQNVRLAIALIIGLILGYGAHWALSQPAADSVPADTTPEQYIIEGDIGVIVKDQPPGNNVEIKAVLLDKPGWVAVHDDVNGVPGRILGAQLFDVGSHAGTIDLLRNTIEGTSYLAVIHSDDGNYKNFNPKTDTILTDKDGKTYVQSFTAKSDASSMTTGTTTDTATTTQN